MKILHIHRLAGDGGAFARFDLELTEYVRIYGLNLKKLADGRIRVFAPHANGRHSCSFHPVVAEKITQAAVAALGAADGGR